MRVAYPGLVAAAAAVPGFVAGSAPDVGALDLGDRLLVASAATAVVVLSKRGRAPALATRIAFVGGPEAGQRLHEDLARAAGDAYVLAGRIGVRRDDDAVPVIGGLGSLRTTVVREPIDLVVLDGAVARLPPFDELTATCLDLPLRITEVSDFYEDVFGHVPAGEINAAWFVHLADAHARHPSPVAKRALDVALAAPGHAAR